MPLADDLGVESVLDVVSNMFGIVGDQRGDEFDMHCPNPGHADSDPSTSVNLTTGLWNCFSCGTSGDLLELGVYVLELPRRSRDERSKSRDQVAQMLKPHTPDALQATLQRRLSSIMLRKPKAKMPKMPGPYEPGPLTYLRGRGFKQKELRRWGVRYAPEETLDSKKLNPDGTVKTFTIQSSIAIPIRDASGRLINWCYRKTDDSPEWQPRYIYFTEGISETWFGLNLHHKERDVVVVEGALDAMWLTQCGYPALGLLGSSMGERKLKDLQRFRSVTILGDRDAAGVKVVNRIGNAIGGLMPVRVARYSSFMDAGDPQDLHQVDLELCIENALPWTMWLRRGKPKH